MRSTDEIRDSLLALFDEFMSQSPARREAAKIMDDIEARDAEIARLRATPPPSAPAGPAATGSDAADDLAIVCAATGYKPIVVAPSSATRGSAPHGDPPVLAAAYRMAARHDTGCDCDVCTAIRETPTGTAPATVRGRVAYVARAELDAALLRATEAERALDCGADPCASDAHGFAACARHRIERAERGRP